MSGYWADSHLLRRDGTWTHLTEPGLSTLIHSQIRKKQTYAISPPPKWCVRILEKAASRFPG